MLVSFQHARVVRGEVDVRNESPVIRLDLDELQREGETAYASMRYKRTSELAAALSRGDFASDPARARSVRFEIQQRRAISSTYLMFLLLGVPTGLLLRRGTQLGALSVAVGYALLYYVLSMRLGKQLATSSILPPFLGAWAINLIGMLAGLGLLGM